MKVGPQRHAPTAVPPGKTRYPFYRRLGGPQGRSGRVWKISPPTGIRTRTVQPVASRYTDWAIAAQLICDRNRISYKWICWFCYGSLNGVWGLLFREMCVFCNANICCVMLLNVAAFDKQILNEHNSYKTRLNIPLFYQQTVRFASEFKYGNTLPLFVSCAGPSGRAV
jgi:hypothetical protein